MTEKRIVRAALIAAAVVAPAFGIAIWSTSVSAVVTWSWVFLVLLVVVAIVSALLGLVGAAIAAFIAAWLTPEYVVVPEPFENAVIRSLEEEIDALTTERDNALFERDNPDFRNSPRYSYLDKD
jgi:hypothetical protein